jgi:hypothetical protein
MEQAVHVGEGQPVRPPYRDLASGQRHRLQAAQPPVFSIRGREELASPYGAVRPEARPVEGNADHGVGQAVVRHARGYMTVVVLNRDEGK